MTDKQDAGVNLSANQLQDILAAVLAEARKPVVTDEEKRAREQALKDREEQAQLILQKMANEAAFKKICTHTRRDGSTRAVYVHLESHPDRGYMLCQLCRDTIFPSERPEVFNRLFQLSSPALFD